MSNEEIQIGLISISGRNRKLNIKELAEMWQRNTSLNSNPAFVRRSLFVTLGIVVVALNVLSQDASRESGPGRPWSQAADRAAITFAKELAPEGTAQYYRHTPEGLGARKRNTL